MTTWSLSKYNTCYFAVLIFLIILCAVDDGKQERKDAKNELEKNDENKTSKAEHQEPPALVFGHYSLLCSKSHQVPLTLKGASKEKKKWKAQHDEAQITPSNVKKLDPAMAAEEEFINSALPPENPHFSNSSTKKASFSSTYFGHRKRLSCGHRPCFNEGGSSPFLV